MRKRDRPGQIVNASRPKFMRSLAFRCVELTCSLILRIMLSRTQLLLWIPAHSRSLHSTGICLNLLGLRTFAIPRYWHQWSLSSLGMTLDNRRIHLGWSKAVRSYPLAKMKCGVWGFLPFLNPSAMISHSHCRSLTYFAVSILVVMSQHMFRWLSNVLKSSEAGLVWVHLLHLMTYPPVQYPFQRTNPTYPQNRTIPLLQQDHSNPHLELLAAQCSAHNLHHPPSGGTGMASTGSTIAGTFSLTLLAEFSGAFRYKVSHVFNTPAFTRCCIWSGNQTKPQPLQVAPLGFLNTTPEDILLTQRNHSYLICYLEDW